MNIKTINDMLNAIAEALKNDDSEALVVCNEVNQLWFQTDEQRDAINELIKAAWSKLS